MTGNGVTIQIGYYPGSTVGQVKKDENGYHYAGPTGEKIYLAEDWYPGVEGTYIKLTHTPENAGIKSITHNDAPQTLSPNSLPQYSSVTVYYWSLDNTCSKPLLIRLGEGNNQYYKNNGNSWSRDLEATNNLRKALDKQNCERSQAHIINLSQKGNTNYPCPSCRNSQKFKTQEKKQSGYADCTHSLSGSGTFSVSGFKNAGTWQTGLSSLKTVSTIRVYWDRSAPNLIVVQFQRGSTDRYFRKNARGGNSWIEVSADSSETALSTTVTTPSVDLDLSNISGKPYTVGSTKVIVAVLDSNIGDGYYRYQYSLCGGLFNVTQVKHESIPLTGISSQGTLISISAYYYGDTLDLEKLLLVELAIKTSNQTKYSYYQKDKDGTNWAELRRPGGYISQLIGEPLKVTLDKLKELKGTLDQLNRLNTEVQELERKLNESYNTGILAGTSVGTGLGGAGLGGLAVWKGPALIARLITRL